MTMKITMGVRMVGEEVILTDFGKPVARIVPFMPTVTVSPADARASGMLDDESILAAIAEAREDQVVHLDP